MKGFSGYPETILWKEQGRRQGEQLGGRQVMMVAQPEPLCPRWNQDRAMADRAIWGQFGLLSAVACGSRHGGRWRGRKVRVAFRSSR